MNLTSQIQKLSQQLAKTTDPEEREELEVELANLQDELDNYEDDERYDWG